MPADVAFQAARPVSQPQASVQRGRLPIGVGLTLAASMSIGLWFAAAAGLRALFS